LRDGAAFADVLRSVTARACNDAIIVLTNATGAYEAPDRLERDSDNTVDAKAERGSIGTRLGPNANGRKW
jgi:hypothetical protein